MENNVRKDEIIEETGLLFESLGTTRMAGRILGYLMVSEAARVSFDEFTRSLRASKSTISTNLKTLLLLQYVRAVSLPGDRKTYYSLNNDSSWTEAIRVKSGMIRMFIRLFGKAMELRSDPADNSSLWLAKARKFYEFSERMLPVMIEEWKKIEAES